MSEDITNIPISSDRLLAAILKNVGEVEVSVEDLVADYSEFQVSVDQERDGFVLFSLVAPDES
jgi:hypothetical protein